MTRLAEIAAFVPEKDVPVEAVCGPDGPSEAEVKLLRRYYGLDSVRWAPELDLARLLVAAAERLTALPAVRGRVRYVIAARTLQAVAPDTTAVLRQVCRELGLGHARAFALTQHACASGLLAVDVAGRLLASDGEPDALALLLTGEKAFTPSARFIPGTTVMGEGTAAVLVGGDTCPGDRVLSYATRTCGEYRDGLAISPEQAARFGNTYTETLAEVVRTAVDMAGLSLADIDLVLPHNVNRISWVRWCRHAGYPVDQVHLDNVPVTGHCFCADPFINHDSAVASGRLKPHDHYLMVAVGLGATFSAMVLEKS
ncbi:3-oxoacyl-[acyl-carrier-protein] synthase III C-terminal domain-containing protein [Streptomyces sp. NPDC005538]|uniref:3-oxoacyl-[acyl-carrier-protein] synthase III C-terminal domain-containing protein n=1 Tax=unclassified Streptomyces TaxID=2593676 RepID=UPI0033B45841